MKKAAYLIENKESFQYRYRVKNIREALEKSEEWELEIFLKSELASLDFRKINLLVIERQTAKDNSILEFIKRAKNNNIKVLFDIDDLVFDYKDLFRVKNTVKEKNILYWAGYFWGIRRIAKKVDGFIVTNDFLGKKISASFKKPYKVIRNFLNEEQVKVSERDLKYKKHDGFLVGYFSGSPSHDRDFRLVEKELIRFLEDFRDVKLRIVGKMKLSEEMREWEKLGRVERIDFVDYLKLQKLIVEVDVNIAPLVLNNFTNCKSELKFFEAGAVETTTIASPNYSFKKAIIDGENGFLAKPGEWYDKLKYLYENPKENQKIAKRAKEYALKHYYGKEVLKEIEETYDYFAK